MTPSLDNRHLDSLVSANILQTDARDTITHDVWLHDDTLRDGEQMIGIAFSVEQKLEIAGLLLDAGVRTISAGFPAVSEQERECATAIVKLADPSRFTGFCRAMKSDIEAAMKCGLTGVGMFVPISDSHLKYKMEIDEDTAFKRMRESIALARSNGLSVRFGFEDCTRAPLERVRRFVSGAIEAGASQVAIADTVGILTPLSTYALISQLMPLVGAENQIMVHFHDDLGMATANSLVACAAGAQVLMGTLCGIGERAGNASLEEMAVALRVKYGVNCSGVDLQKLAAAANRLAEIARLPVAPNKAILGRNVFSHESGIHVHGLLRERSTYEPFPPELIGTKHEVHYGKHSSMSNMQYLVARTGIAASERVMLHALETIKQLGLAGRSPHAGEAAVILRQAALEAGELAEASVKDGVAPNRAEGQAGAGPNGADGTAASKGKRAPIVRKWTEGDRASARREDARPGSFNQIPLSNIIGTVDGEAANRYRQQLSNQTLRIHRVVKNAETGFQYGVYYVAFTEGSDFPNHSHQKSQASIMVVEGVGYVFLDGVRHPIQAGDVVHIPPAVAHEFFVARKGDRFAYVSITQPDIVVDGDDVRRSDIDWKTEPSNRYSPDGGLRDL